MSARIVKAGGIAGLLAAALLVLSAALTQIASPGLEYLTTTDYVHQVIRLAAFLATLVTLVAQHARQRSNPRYGRVGTAGTVLAVTGYAVVASVVAAGVIAGERVLNDARIAGAGLLLVGSVLVGIATLRARILPWWCGVLLIVAFPLGDLADSVVFGAEGLLFAALWGSLGVALLTRTGSPADPAAERPERIAR